MEKKLANIERQKKEENLRQLAQKARNTRIGIKETLPDEGNASSAMYSVHVAECIVVAPCVCVCMSVSVCSVCLSVQCTCMCLCNQECGEGNL